MCDGVCYGSGRVASSSTVQQQFFPRGPALPMQEGIIARHHGENLSDVCRPGEIGDCGACGNTVCGTSADRQRISGQADGDGYDDEADHEVDDA